MTAPLECIVVLCTVPNADAGDALARGIVEARLAACVNRIGPMRSVYRWQGEVHAHEEHQDFFRQHFVKKGAEVAQACLETLEALTALPQAA